MRGIFRPDAFEVDHHGFVVTVTHPRLHRANVHAIAKMVRRESVTELVKKEVDAIRAFDALVAMIVPRSAN